jgi:hypothetical protein
MLSFSEKDEIICDDTFFAKFRPWSPTWKQHGNKMETDFKQNGTNNLVKDDNPSNTC